MKYFYQGNAGRISIDENKNAITHTTILEKPNLFPLRQTDDMTMTEYNRKKTLTISVVGPPGPQTTMILVIHRCVYVTTDAQTTKLLNIIIAGWILSPDII